VAKFPEENLATACEAVKGTRCSRVGRARAFI
jgi:hypothetical protein